MPKLSVDVPHALGQPEALSRVQGMLNQLKAQYGDQVSNLQESWNGPVGEFSMKAMGFDVSGRIVVGERSVEMDGNLPLMATPFKGQIEQRLREEATRLLS
jgi:hypothetical protein